MRRWTTVATATEAGGAALALQERDGEFALRSGGQLLMSSARHGSEEALAEAGLRGLGLPAPRVLVGGLGFGYTLRAALDLLPAARAAGGARAPSARARAPGATVTVAEVSSAVVAWNRGVLAPLAGAPLSDPRVCVLEADVAEVVKRSSAAFDAILLDVDNGPAGLPTTFNARLYSPRGLAWFREALSRRGRLVVWSAGPDQGFLAALSRAGFQAEQRPVAARARGASRHVLFVAARAR